MLSVRAITFELNSLLEKEVGVGNASGMLDVVMSYTGATL